MRSEARPTVLEEAPMPITSAIMVPMATARDTVIDDILRDSLHTIRLHLGMDVAFVSEFAHGRRFFRYIDTPDEYAPIQVGDSDPLDESYCKYVVEGRLPQLMQDAALVPLALSMPATLALPVGAHISVPIHFSDGQVYGTFCCFKSTPDMTLTDRDLSLIQMFAEFTGKQLERHQVANRSYDEMRERIRSVIDQRSFTIVYQPIFDFVQDRVVGFEALARFLPTPIRPPNVWFDEATQVGMVEALEMTVMAEAIRGLAQLPHDSYLSLNVAPMSILSGAIVEALTHAPLDRLVLEITEHVSIHDYTQLSAALAPLRERGARLAVDDAGAGYASFRHILRLDPDLIKLDISLTRDIDTDHTRRALAAALISFAQETGSSIIAEGVETVSELSMLRHLRIDKAQGYLIGRPMSLVNAIALLPLAPRGDAS